MNCEYYCVGIDIVIMTDENRDEFDCDSYQLTKHENSEEFSSMLEVNPNVTNVFVSGPFASFTFFFYFYFYFLWLFVCVCLLRFRLYFTTLL